jgi:hypothetical protein
MPSRRRSRPVPGHDLNRRCNRPGRACSDAVWTLGSPSGYRPSMPLTFVIFVSASWSRLSRESLTAERISETMAL